MKSLPGHEPCLLFQLRRTPSGSCSPFSVTSALHQFTFDDLNNSRRDWQVLGGAVHAEDRERFEQTLEDSARTLDTWHEEFRYCDQDETRWFQGLANPEQQADGTTLWTGIIQDITARRQEEERLQMFRFSIEQAADAVFWMDEAGTFPYVNEQACRSLGYTSEELKHLHLWDIDPYFPKKRWEKLWTEYQADQVNATNIETWHRRKDGHIFPVEIAAKHCWLGGKEFHVAFARDITERKAIEEELRASEAKYRSVVDNIGIGIALISPEMKVLSINKVGRERFPAIDFDQHPICYQAFNSPPREAPCQYCACQKTFADGKVHETITETPSGVGIRNFKVTTSPILDQDGTVTAVIEMAEDVTEKLRFEAQKEALEGQLRQAQKMEAIGTLAGGIAHDFNNMLSVILGYAEMTKSRLLPDDPLYLFIEEIEKAAERSRDTTRQLLAFSRKQVVTPKSLDINLQIANTQKTLARLIGEHIELHFSPDPDLWRIKIDPAQFDQIIINLAINARDAMPDGGRLVIATANAPLDEAFCHQFLDCVPGNYVRLTVNDTGGGMDRETLAHAFEPFYTTKEVGKGTGLGLSTVYGIIKQNDGFIDIASTPEKGTTFTMYFPEDTGQEASGTKDSQGQGSLGSETILLVEDDHMVRRMTQAMLTGLGYTVLAAASPEEAIQLAGNKKLPIDLLLTDVVMPGMSGPDLRTRIAAIRPTINILFMSGYAATIIDQNSAADQELCFIQKPFSREELALALRAAIEGK